MTTKVNEPEQKSFFANLFAKDPDTVPGVPKEIETTHEAGMERLRKMYSLDEYGYRSKELTMIVQSCTMAFIGGGVIGSVIQSREAYRSFIENNHATKFASHLDAKRLLQRHMYLAFAKGAWHLGSRVGMFSLTYTTLMTTISVYRGKESLMEYVVAGGITGTIYKLNMGLQGAFAGGVLGTVLGLIAGSLSLLALKVGGTSLDEMRDFSKQMSDYRTEAIRTRQQKYMKEEHAELVALPADATEFEKLNADETE